MKTRKRTPEVKRAIACAEHGHPRIIGVCFGQVTCGRCDAILGDTLMGSFNTKEAVVLGHDCKECRKNAKALDRHETVHLPEKVRAEIKKLRAAR